jgi:fatty-acyl-CoA synthase
MYKDCYGLSVPQLFERAYRLSPEKEVLADGYRRMTYRELQTEATILASGLTRLGIHKGDRVAVCLPNWHEFVVIYLAVAKIGAILVPFNTRYREHEVEYILRNSGAKIAFFTREFSNVRHFDQFTRAKQQLSTLEMLVSVRFEAEGLISYERLLDNPPEPDELQVQIDPKEDVFTILYTSGTTGMPKGAMLTHDNVVHTATITAETMRCTDQDVFFIAVPVFHVFGMVPSILTALSARARMVLMEQYNAKNALALIEQERITVHHGVPTMFILELNYPDFKKYDLSSLRTGIIAAAPCPVEIVRRIRFEMNCDIVVAYGLSETSPTLTMTGFDDDDIVRSETVGKVLPGAEVKVVDHNRREVPTGEVGELACRGFGVMKGYYNMPEKTREAIDQDGWFYTGDLAMIDAQGYIRIVGRKKEMIIRGGYNIYPREVEEVFYTHPSVLEVAIVGLPDTVLGEISCAAIRLKPNATVTPEELREFIKSKVADYKVPDKIVFLQEFPMTASGKIKKVDLQESLKEHLGAELR